MADNIVQAVRENEWQEVERMIKDWNINRQDPLGRTAFFEAVRKRHDLSRLEFLIAHGADINIKDRFGNTAFHYVTTAEQLEWFIRHGVDINIRGRYGNNLLQCAIQHGLNELADALLKHGAHKEETDVMDSSSKNLQQKE